MGKIGAVIVGSATPQPLGKLMDVNLDNWHFRCEVTLCASPVSLCCVIIGCAMPWQTENIVLATMDVDTTEGVLLSNPIYMHFA